MKDRAKLIKQENTKEERQPLKQLTQEEQIQKSLRWMINQQDFNVAITLTFNINVFISASRAKMTLRHWDARINRRLLGNKWLSKIDRHIKYFAFLEKRSSNPHYHLVANISEDLLERFNQINQEMWLKIMPSGECQSQEITNQSGWINYITKELKYIGSYENMIISSDFK